MPPDQAARRELLLSAAQQCQRQYPFVMRFEFDRFDRLLWLYRETASQSDRDAFSRCYAESVQQFTRAAAAAAPSTPAGQQVSQGPAIEAPALRPGYEWTYRWESPRGSGTFVWELNRIETTLDDVDCYVVRSGRREILWRKTDLASVLERVGQVTELKYVPPRLNITWPLRVGNSWEQLLVRERPQERQTTSLYRSWRVESFEQVKVPAGTFGAFKITSRDKWADTLVVEAWYAAEVRNVVRTIDHTTSGGAETRVLTSFKLD
jgi:hypothetical protein